MDNIWLWVAIFGALVGFSLLWRYVLSSRATLKRELRQLPRTPIAEVEDGEEVKIVGTIQLDPESPEVSSLVMKHPCVYFQSIVERSGGSTSHRETLIDTNSFAASFFVEDETGRALVEPVLPDVILTMDTHLARGPLREPIDELERFVEEQGLSDQGWTGGKQLTFTEGTLVAGETVAVVGVCHWEEDPTATAEEGDADQPVAMRLRIEASDENCLLISDDPTTL